jgi:hypothetical protein
MATKIVEAERLDNLEVRKAIRWLRSEGDRDPFKEGYYRAYLHPDVEFDLISDPEIISVWQYANPPRSVIGKDLVDPEGKKVIAAVYGAEFHRTKTVPEILEQDYVLITKASMGLYPDTKYITVFKGTDKENNASKKDES